MNLYESISEQSYILNERTAREIFSILPEGGLLVAIMDRQGNFWPSDSDRFSKLDIEHQIFDELRARIDDGVEPVIVHLNDFCVAAKQLATTETNCGYIIVALEKAGSDMPIQSRDLIEMILNQAVLITQLIEKNHKLHEFHNKHLTSYKTGQLAVN